MTITESSPAHRKCSCLKFRTFKVGSSLRRVNAAVLCESSDVFRKVVSEIADHDTPIVLPRITMRQFDHLLWGLEVNSIPPPRDKGELERILDVEEFSRHYSIHQLQIRTESTILAAIAEGTNAAILACNTFSLVRMLKITMRVHTETLFSFLMQLWTWRLHSRELDYAFAIRLAQPSLWDHDPQPFLKVLGHAFYAAMMKMMEPNLSSGQRIELDSRLTQSDLVHVLCGYHSLRCWWDQIASKPPSYMHSPSCTNPERCTGVWRIRFQCLTEEDKIPFPKIDGIRRLQELHRLLAGDVVLINNMSESCRRGALQELLKRKEHLLKTVHHHFDL
ncbi:hypothetical protein F5878DRAFT_663972 [Lentinula raphanica]|uniref:BTB domain-containing protein n=1 Tax=Lentinula raphanica TaxID=153919 RepID=A0AA38P334_9AGAR|nr:hypothetical protein F5878DRAFT_663972 [Lentinula raphanica]